MSATPTRTEGSAPDVGTPASTPSTRPAGRERWAGRLLLGLTLTGALAVSLATGLTAGVARASDSDGRGKIVFQTNRDGNNEIYTMRADGTNRVNLTRNPAQDITPHWSADGRRIVFVSDRDGNDEIFTMSDIGGDVRQRTFTAGVNNRWPSWTADGRILFQRVVAGAPRDVILLSTDGSETLLTSDSVDSAWATAAPWGPSIAFSRYTPADGQRLYTMNTKTQVMKPLMAAPPDAAQLFDYQVNWSPNGDSLVFVRSGPAATDLYIVRKDGTGLRLLTPTPARDEERPAFSDDGRRIVFTGCSINPAEIDGKQCSNYVVNVDGSNEAEVTLRPQAPYADDFRGNWVDPFWSLGITGTGPAIAQANDRLEVTLPVGTTLGNDGYANAFAFMACRFPGDFDMQVDYRLLSGALPPDGVHVGFDAAELTFGGTYVGQHGVFVHRPGGVPGVSTHFPDPLVNVFQPDASSRGSLRLIRKTTSGVTTMTVKRRGAYGDWVTMLTRNAAAVDVSAANLNVFTNLSPFPAEVKVAYDNFRINSGSITCPTWWDDVSPDWQPDSR